MSKTKLLSSEPAKKTVPKNIQEWNQLLSQVIRRAEENEDRRLEGLRRAMVEGRSEKMLRGMSILSATDIDREFPKRTP